MTLDIGCCSRAQEVQGRHSRGVFKDAIGIRTEWRRSFNHPYRAEDLRPGPNRDRGPGPFSGLRVKRVANDPIGAVDAPVLLRMLRELWNMARQNALLPTLVDLL